MLTFTHLRRSSCQEEMDLVWMEASLVRVLPPIRKKPEMTQRSIPMLVLSADFSELSFTFWASVSLTD